MKQFSGINLPNLAYILNRQSGVYIYGQSSMENKFMDIRLFYPNNNEIIKGGRYERYLNEWNENDFSLLIDEFDEEQCIAGEKTFKQNL
jgi:hypothetical protein